MEGEVAGPRPAPARLLAALVVCLAAGLLHHLQVRPGFVPSEVRLDLSRPEAFLLPGSGAVGPSHLGRLRWTGDRPLRLRMPGLGPPGRLGLTLFPECSGARLEVRVAGALAGELRLGRRWRQYELDPEVPGDTLTLALAPGSPHCPVHLSAVRSTTVERRSSGYPEYWVVRPGPGTPGPPVGGAAPWMVAGLLLATAAAAAARGGKGVAGWLWLVAPGVAVLAVAEAGTRAAGLRLVYPAASYPGFLALAGGLVLLWRHRRAVWNRVRPPLRTVAVWARPRPALVLGALALLGWAWVLAGHARQDFGGDLRGVIHFGERFGTAERFPGVPVVGPSGYDGQFYAVLATDPFLVRPETVEALDTPRYRATRILVPLLAWALALGRPEAAVWTYMGLCWLLTLGTIPLAARWLEDRGASGWWAALLITNAGLAVAVLRVTLDGAALLFLLLALAAWRRERTGWAALAATAAALTRETYVLGGLALAAVELRRRRWARAAAQGVPPVLALGLWRLRVTAVIEPGGAPVESSFAPPFAWLPGKLARLEELSALQSPWLLPELAALLGVALAATAALPLLPRAGREPAALALAAFAALVPFLSAEVYHEIYAFARILVPLPVLAVVLSAEPGLPRWTRWWLLAAAVPWALAGLWVVRLLT